MLVLVSGASATVDRLAPNPHLGQLVTPYAGNVVRGDMPWAADNGCFGGFEAVAFRAMLARLPLGGLFVVVPDVVADHSATLKLWRDWRADVVGAGQVPAFVLQDGCDKVPVDAGAVFVGGSTSYKLSTTAARLVEDAKMRGLWVHMGRVNTRRRTEYAASIGCDSIDGTSVSRFPDAKLPSALRWAAVACSQTRLAL